MITYLLIASLFVTLVGFGLLVHGLVHAPEGYEDDSGFHLATAHSRSPAWIAYEGPERRGTARRRDTRAVGQHYRGPRRRATDALRDSDFNIPHVGGFA